MVSRQQFVTESISVVAMPIRGTKRKASQHKWPNPKKVRASEASPKFEEEDRSSTSVGDSQNTEREDEAKPNKSVTTPITSQSSSSPRYPSNAKTIPCTFDGCKKLFNRQAKLIQHVRSHTDTRPFVCHYTPCTKAYLRDTHLQHHIKSAHSQIRDYVCTWNGCDKAFATGTRFRRHIAAHEGNTKTCTIDGCGQVFRKHSTMEAHIKKFHQGLKPHTCQYLDDDGKMCGTGFDSPAQLRSHEGRLHARNTFECTICLPDEDGNSRRTFPTYGTLQEHIRTGHPPICDLCGFACASKSSLKSHIEVRHGGTAIEERKKFTCPEVDCGRGFTKKGNMNAHIQSAHNNKRYVCSSINEANLNNVEGWDSSFRCAEGFSTKANLEKHIRTAHIAFEGRDKSRKQRIVPTTKTTPTINRRTTKAYDNLVSCTVLGCNDRFPTIYELAFHLEARHGLADHEIQATIPADRDKDAVFARPGFQGTTAFASREDLDAEAAFDMLVDADPDPDLELENNEDLSNRDSFWIGGVGTDRANGADEWPFDEQEMRRLINNSLYDVEDADTKAGQDKMDLDIDPSLL